MRLKTFHADTMIEAMRAATKAFGEDAVIVSSDELPEGGFAVTAAVDRAVGEMAQSAMAPEPQAPSPAPEFETSTDSIQEVCGDLNAAMDRLIDGLYKHGIPANVTDRILARSELAADLSPQVMLSGVLNSLLTFADLPTGQPLFLLGQPGSGKTLTAAKLAARIVMRGKVKPIVVSCDTLRAGGIAQLEAITNILDVPLQTAETPAELTEHLETTAPVIVDLPGVNAFDPKQMKHVADFLKTAPNALPLMVMPAGLDAYESAEIARAFAILGAKHMLVTRMDVARRYGGVLAAADQTGMALTLMSDTPQIADGLSNLTAERLATAILPPRVQKETL